MQIVSWRVRKLHNLNANAVSIYTTEKHQMGRLSLQERGMAVGLINANVTQANVSANLTRFTIFISFLKLKM